MYSLVLTIMMFTAGSSGVSVSQEFIPIRYTKEECELKGKLWYDRITSMKDGVGQRGVRGFSATWVCI